MITRASILGSKIFRQQAFIAGSWTDSGDGSTFDVSDPADGSVIARVANCTTEDVQRALDQASAAWDGWKDRTGKERAAILRRWFDLMIENRDHLAGLMSLEQGKPLREAADEVTYGAAYIEWFAEEAKRVEGHILPGHQRDKRIMVIRQPIGVVAAITPWNFPIAMITRKCAPALAAGCPVVVKPASQTPLCALALAELGRLAGLPDGVLSVLPSNRSAAVGKHLTESRIVRKLSFTGSTQTGRILLQQSAGTIKKASMELGGNAPVIIFDDADIDKAVDGALAAKFRNAGQTCVCANRIYVQSSIYDEFAARFALAVERLTIGSSLQGDFDLGPLIDEKALGKVRELVADATDKGAVVLAGGKVHDLGGTFYKPTVLSGVTERMAIATEEVFGPVASLLRFDTEAEVIARANDTEFGLASYIFSQDIDRVFRVAEKIEAGMVGINTGVISTEVAPFGGVKESGLGREGSRFGIEDYLEMKYLCLSVKAE
jgi:succinate-semialdehyde dehydrogenase/glutarate-semialdehyde dehydrogenase